jgi:excinuclease ABC subunit B
MYADSVTEAMRQAIDETDRRREKQVAYNTEHGIDPQPLRRKIADILDRVGEERGDDADPKDRPELVGARAADGSARPRKELEKLIEEMTEQMMSAATDLRFELAGRLRDEIAELRKELKGMREAGID